MNNKIKWGNRELPGVSHDELSKLTPRVLTATERGNLNVELGKFGNGIGNYESRKRGALKSVANQKESGNLKKFTDSGTKAAAEKAILEKEERRIRFYNIISDTFSDQFQIKDLAFIDEYFPEYTNHKKAYRRFLSDDVYFKTLGFKNKARCYIRIETI
jgi:hypothetical protein